MTSSYVPLPDEAVVDASPLTAPSGVRSSQPRIPSLHAAIESIVQQGPIRRLPTGIPTLDEITRGGLMFGRCVVVGGAPNTGKTTVLVQMAMRAIELRHPVAIHCADVDDREALLIRIGQAHGVALEALERRDQAAWARVGEIVGDLPLIIADQEEDSVSLEDTIAALDSLGARARLPAVLCVDSVQTARSTRQDGGRPGIIESESDRVRANAVALKEAAKHHGWLVVYASELGRGAYRSRRAKDQVADVAAYKWAGEIEYSVAVGLILREGAESGVVDVAVPKNKRGVNTRSFTLSLDPSTCTLTEIEGLDIISTALEDKIVATLVHAGPAKNIESLAKRVGKRKEDVARSAKVVCDQGRAIKTRDGYRAAATDPGSVPGTNFAVPEPSPVPVPRP